MIENKITELIDNSELPRFQKLIAKGFIQRNLEAEQKASETLALIKEVGKEKNINEVLLSSDEVKIYSVSGKGEWEIKYPIRSIYKKDDKWVRNSVVSPDFDTAYLSYLQHKHLGANSDFSFFAMKMLGIELED
jgi:hypothetical protein